MHTRATSKSPWDIVTHELGTRRRVGISPIHYDENVRYVLEDISLQLGRIADALEGKTKGKTND